jgi:hypothetical protein
MIIWQLLLSVKWRRMLSYEVKTADIRDGNEYKIRKWLVLKFHGSGHLQIILHLNKITNVWKWPLSKLCLLLMYFLVLKPHWLQVYFIRQHTTPFYWQQQLPDNREYIKIQEWILKQSYVQRNIELAILWKFQSSYEWLTLNTRMAF